MFSTGQRDIHQPVLALRADTQIFDVALNSAQNLDSGIVVKKLGFGKFVQAFE
jgi:hypothetical protein